jgi:pyroglutamyl-peptidase
MLRRDDKPTILLTGFGPFLTVTANVTSTVVPAVAQRVTAQFPRLHCVAEVLPTDWIEAPARLDALVQEHRPAIILQFGVSPRARGFVIETRGRNERQASIDASSCKPKGFRVVTGGPKFLATSLPIKPIITRLHALGLPAARSHSAGQYVCNALLYHGLWAAQGAAKGAAADHKPPMMGFIHLPVVVPEAATARRKLTMDQAIAGGIAIVTACHDALHRQAI